MAEVDEWTVYYMALFMKIMGIQADVTYKNFEVPSTRIDTVVDAKTLNDHLGAKLGKAVYPAIKNGLVTMTMNFLTGQLTGWMSNVISTLMKGTLIGAGVHLNDETPIEDTTVTKKKPTNTTNTTKADNIVVAKSNVTEIAANPAPAPG